jgi:hypothetical protein
MNYHGYVDQSKRRPYRCGVCGLDILHPVHQPTLAGLFYVPEPDPEPIEDEPEPEPFIRRPHPQLALF